jgi:hypothetical protein
VRRRESPPFHIHSCRGYHGSVDIWLKRSSSFEEDSEADAEFWRRVSPDERVAILEQMRQEWLREHGRGDEGLRRTARRIPPS